MIPVQLDNESYPVYITSGYKHGQTHHRDIPMYLTEMGITVLGNASSPCVLAAVNGEKVACIMQSRAVDFSKESPLDVAKTIAKHMRRGDLKYIIFYLLSYEENKIRYGLPEIEYKAAKARA